MFSKIVTIIFAVSFISVTSGFVINANLRVLEPILKCYETEDSAPVLAFEKAIEEHEETFADDLKLTCASMEVIEQFQLINNEINLWLMIKAAWQQPNALITCR